MQVQVLGCHGGVAPGCKTSCYCINEKIYIDAGSIASTLTHAEQKKVNHVFITHTHLDHIKDLAFLIDNTFDSDREPLTIYSTKEINKSLHRHIFNNIIWPDFTKITVYSSTNKTNNAILRFQTLEEQNYIEGCTISYIPVNHPGYAVGFVVDDGEKQIIFSGDSGPTFEIWDVANKCPHLKAIFAEISFPNRMEALAQVSGHFTTSQLIHELDKIDRKDVPVYIAHLKPTFLDELIDEFHKLAPPRLKLLHQNDILEF